MSLFDDVLGHDESLFVNEIALDFEYLPKELPYRENKQKYIAECIKPLLQKRNGRNLFISGSPGIGKTAAVKHILRELEEKGLDDELYLVYINCWKKNTSHKMIVSLCEQIGYKFTHNKTTEELTRKVSDIVNKKSLLLVLDEVDKSLELDIIYNLLEDVYRKTILMVTNEEKWLSKLDPRLRSRLLVESLQFQPYNYEETREILKRRRELAFVANIWQDEAFEVIVNKAYSVRDLRTGLFLLRESGLIAEQKSSKKITKEHTDQSITKLTEHKIKSSLDLEDEIKKILNLIKLNSGKSSMELYELYKQDRGDKGYRTFYRKLKDLEKSKLITIEQISLPTGGQSSSIIYGSNT